MKNRKSCSSWWWITLLWGVWLSGCASMNSAPVPPISAPLPPPPPVVQPRTDPFEQSKALFSQGQYEAAIVENQKILQDRRGSPDVALFNMGMISAHPTNPKKNYPRALSSFRTLVKEYPQSPMVDPAKTWITVLEEQQKIADEKRSLTKEREALLLEKDKLKYTIEKSRQVDIEIEKRRRGTLQK